MEKTAQNQYKISSSVDAVFSTELCVRAFSGKVIVNRTPPDLSKLGDLDWLVEARSEIEKLMLEHYNNLDPLFDREPQLVLGALFSLWRAVFLVETKDMERDKSTIGDNARSYLKKLIESNSINFNADMKMRTWSSGYYLNNARYRVKILLGENASKYIRPHISDEILKDVWNETFYGLWQVIHREK